MCKRLERIENYRKEMLARDLQRKADWHDELIERGREPSKESRREKQMVEIPGMMLFGCKIYLKG